MRKRESEKHKSWGMPAEGFKGHVATDGSLLGNAGKWGACGWVVEMGPLHGILCLLRKACGPMKVHVDKKGMIDGLPKRDKECIKPEAIDADLWKIFEKYMKW